MSLAACSNFENIANDCPDAKVSWINVMMINGIKYEGEDKGLSEGEPLQKGAKLGEVAYTLADNACSNHRLKDGDAAFLPIGTEIFELVGYKSDFRVIANNTVYQVSDNEKAETMADLLDIKDKVVKLSLESNKDGSHISDFPYENSINFIEDLLAQKYLGYDQVYKKIEGSNRVFLRVHLVDGSSFRIVYWIEDNIVHLGAYGTEKMKEIVKNKEGI
jgi:hypothetical protein